MSVPISFAQFSDSHLFANTELLHCGANVYQNLLTVLSAIDKDLDITFLIFTGDLTQDHSKASYQRFFEAYQQSITRKLPCYYVAGNHDDLALMEDTFAQPPFNTSRTIDLASWQIQLLDSKSEIPAGLWREVEQRRVADAMDEDKLQILMMHHHCVDVDYFIDRHGLQNQSDFYQFAAANPHIKAVFCGHVHNDMTLNIPQADIPLFTCPATCLQFDKHSPTVKDAQIGVGYRKIMLSPQHVETHTIFIDS